MALVYEYKDEFVVDSVDVVELEKQELKAIHEIDLIGTTDAIYKEKLVVYSVYMELALMQLEADGMKEKYDGYAKEYNRYWSLALTNTPTNVATIPLGRG